MSGEEGWAGPVNSRKSHYFVGHRSLCGKWAYGGYLSPDEDRRPDWLIDCAKCRRELTKRAST